MEAQMMDLERLLQAASTGALAIPDFQREFIWPDNSVKLLLGTALNGWPAGSLLLMRNGANLFRLRPLENAPPLANVRYVVLDGQQRITALYHALYDAGPTVYAIDLSELERSDPNYASVEDYIVGFDREDWDQHYRTIEAQRARRLIPMYVLRSASDFFLWRDEVSQTGLLLPDEDLRRSLTSLYREALASIHRYAFPAVVLETDLDVSAIARIFERVNRTGLRLSTFDLMVARVYEPGWNLRDQWQLARDRSPLLDDYLGDDGVPILQAIALKVRGDVRQSAVLALNASIVRDNWEQAVAGTQRALQFFQERCGLLSSEWLPYNVMLVGLAAWAMDRQPVQNDELLRKWFWTRTFGLSFDAAANTRIVSEYAFLRRAVVGETDVKATTVNQTLLLLASRRSHRALWAGFLCALAANGATDILSGEPVGPGFIAGRRPASWGPAALLSRDLPAPPYEPAFHLRTMNLVLATRSSTARIRNVGLRSAVSSALDYGDESRLDAALESQFLPPARELLELTLEEPGQLMVNRLIRLERFLRANAEVFIEPAEGDR